MVVLECKVAHVECLPGHFTMWKVTPNQFYTSVRGANVSPYNTQDKLEWQVNATIKHQLKQQQT